MALVSRRNYIINNVIINFYKPSVKFNNERIRNTTVRHFSFFLNSILIQLFARENRIEFREPLTRPLSCLEAGALTYLVRLVRIFAVRVLEIAFNPSPLELSLQARKARRGGFRGRLASFPIPCLVLHARRRFIPELLTRSRRDR